jgi:hypothetical protein
MKLEIFLYLLTIFEFKFFINFLLTKILLHYENFTNTVLWCKGSPVPCLPTGRESGLPDKEYQAIGALFLYLKLTPDKGFSIEGISVKCFF